tara:strand:+ start:2162 stop:4063 length:1902 start_codon:yes stop_codon:yes gene_type:complete
MCGIAGLITPNINLDDISLVKQMTSTIAHRGPDGEGFQHSKFIAFGHRRLSVIDIQNGSQPMMSNDERFVLTFNGEIYNYKELRRSLEKQGVKFYTNTDTEVLLHTLIIYGDNAMDQLIGMYAFAFHDKQTGRTIISRDEMGVKPLYYTINDNKLYFASEIKALLENKKLKAGLEQHALKQYLTFQFCLDELTLFEGIYVLKPAHYLDFYVSDLSGGINQKCYWRLNYETDFSITEEKCYHELGSLIEDSIKLQLRSDVALGAYVSGGIDSSFITAMASKHYKKPLKTFHGRFLEGPDYDESSFARDVCKMHDAIYYETVPTAQQFVDTISKIIYYMDEPTAGPGVFPQYCVSHQASKHVKVVLGGQGGDEIFGGYARYVVAYLEQAIKGAITGSNEEGRHIVNLASISPNLSILNQYTPMLKNFWSEGLFQEMDQRYFRLVDKSPNISKILAFDLFDVQSQKEIFGNFQAIFNKPSTSSYINKMTHFDTNTLLPALLQVEDRVSMSASIEARVPFIDKRILVQMAKTPAAIKFANGLTKNTLRHIAAPLLPKSVIERKDKMGFPVPMKEWMSGGVIRDFVSDVMLSQSSRERGIFQINEIEELIHSEAQFGRELWGALCLELWHQIFIDNSY